MYKLKAKSDVIGGLGDVVMTLKYGIANVDGSTSGAWPVYVANLCTDYNNAPSSVSSVLYQLNQADQAETSRALAAESALQLDAKIKYDTNALAISQEVARATLLTLNIPPILRLKLLHDSKLTLNYQLLSY